MHKVSTVEEVVDFLDGMLDENHAITTIIPNRLGIATKGKQGYTPVLVEFPSNFTYNDVSKIVKKANAQMFPNREPIESAKIVLSSMSRN